MATRFLVPYGRGLRTYDPLLDLHREMNRLFDDVFSFNAGSGDSGTSAYASAPRLDMHETEQELTVEAELPGVDRADLDVRLDGDLLTISGEKRSRRDEKQHNAHLSERSYGRFQRSVQLPFRPEADDVQADFEGGVLKVRLPKRPEALEGSRRIEVKEGQRLPHAATPSASAAGGQAMTSAVGGGDASAAGGKATTASSPSSASSATSKATAPSGTASPSR